ncbi:class I SAM-dependent RNA methyltransferase [Pseudoleptotrichia goodfellowii]|uniref:23S rRNA (Uracil-5-)-methyltransferase RumA n=1 Tax=Pseudoleptotrichia goodfellowii F0264 TaxID=596323 RepID=D0GN43_9FUSO|nr:class I SAM-dependent RNA methyltransferase [Pseudoleptotrichia goodfellowii]EEY34492.1 23S rRNA (uracil-5-)-methyltransferase RumA [Pseudoleptotrichia goodfellowii F0264]
MKRGEEIEIEVTGIEFPNKPYGVYGEKKVYPVGNYIIGHKLKGTVTKIRNKKSELKKIEILEKAANEIEPFCPHFNICGGCTFQNMNYGDQTELKSSLVLNILKRAANYEFEYEKIIKSPKEFEYRNKMEFSFGNEIIDGPLTLGMHKKGSFHDIITVNECKLMDIDFRKILTATADYFRKKEEEGELSFYHRIQHIGYLRNFVIRKGEKTGEISINLITTSQIDFDLSEWKEIMLNLELKNKIYGIIHTINDNLSDSVQSDEENILYGNRDINERIFDLNFKISPYSFFQTNSDGVELLYGKVMEYIDVISENEELNNSSIAITVIKNPQNVKDCVVFDLFSGTGTIGQIVSKKAKQVYGIELIEEAVKKANETAKFNNIKNAEFIAGDVFEKLDELEERDVKPDIIILDPPRPGVGEKTITKLLKYNVSNIIYVSCNPKTLAQDLAIFHNNGYRLVKSCPVDMFPQTPHVEVVNLLVKNSI